MAMIDPGAMTPFYDHSLCAALADEGAEATLYTAPFRYHSLPEGGSFQRREVFARFLAANGPLASRDGVRRLARAAAYPFDWTRLRRQLRSDPPQVAHLQWSLDPRFDRRMVKSLQASGLPVVITAHNAAPHLGEAAGRRGWGALWRSADRLIAPSRFTAEALLRADPDLPTAVEVIPLGHHGPWAEAAKGQEEARRELEVPTDVPLALFFGLQKPYKGLDLLIDAFAACRVALPTARLAICGAPRHPTDEIEARLARHGLEEAVHRRFTFLDLAEAQLWFEAADLVVLPYRQASQSMIPAMAYTFARPVLATAAGAFPEQVLAGETGELVPPGDGAAFGDCLAALLADRDRCRDLGRAGRRFADRRWAWDGIAAATLDVYRSLL
ncbi:MAG: glycosyltransferase family 4 protein [Acidobacteriota bacterium]